MNSTCVGALNALARIAKSEGDAELALEYLSRSNEIKPDAAGTLFLMGTAFRAIGKFNKAIEHFSECLEVKPDHSGASKQLEICRDYARFSKQPRQELKHKHLAIAGVSYCGSTLLSSILGNLPGTANIGESQWLIRKRHRGGSIEIDFDTNEKYEASQCMSCGEDCTVFPTEFRRELQINPANWYEKIAKQYQCDTLISSDKNVPKLKKHDPLLRMSAIVLFKSPLQSWYSNYRKLSLNTGMSPQKDIQKFMDNWIGTYSELLHNFNCEGKKVFLSFDDFCKSPNEHLNQVCEVLNLEFDETVLSGNVKSQHYFGGNNLFNQEVESNNYKLDIRELKQVNLPASDVTTINNNLEMQRIYQQLMEMYWQDFLVSSSAELSSIAA